MVVLGIAIQGIDPSYFSLREPSSFTFRIAPELPRIEVLQDIDNKICTYCGSELHRMGEEVSEQVEFIPSQISVIKHVRPKYSCRACEREGTKRSSFIVVIT